MRALQSIYAWIGIVLIVLFTLPVVGLVRLFDWSPARYATGRTFRVMGSWMTRVNPVWKFTQTGTLPEDPRRPFIVVANHQSSADIPSISRLPWEMKWVAKAELFKVPVVGWLMRMSGDIPVNRRDAESRAAVVRRAKRSLRNHVSVIFMPEGTRSRDARVLRYHDGAFRLAVETGTPILPIAIDGTSEALPKNDWKYGRADVRLHVFDPVETSGLTVEDVPRLRETIRQRTIELIAEWRGVDPSEVDAAPGQRAALASAAVEDAVRESASPTGEDGAKSDAVRV